MGRALHSDKNADFSAGQRIVRPVGPRPFGRQLGRPRYAMPGCFLSSIIRRLYCSNFSALNFEIDPLRPAPHDLAKVFRVDNNTTPFPQNNLFAVEFIQIFGNLLTRGTNDVGERLVTYRQRYQDSTGVG